MTVSSPQEDRPDIFRDIKRAGLTVAVFVVTVLIWAIAAPISSTIRVSGEISSNRLNHTVQHTRGGRIAAVHAALYEEVEAGQVLLKFDRTEEQLQHAALTQRVAYLNAELALIETRLEGQPSDGATKEQNNPSLLRLFTERDAILHGQIASGAQQVAAAEQKQTYLQTELEANRNLRAQVSTRMEKSAKLHKRGYLAETVIEETRETLLELDASIARQTGQIEALRAEARTTQMRNDLLQVEYNEHLAATRAAHDRELISLQAELARLDYELSHSDVRATTSGMITQFEFGTPGMVASAGATLALIAQPLAEPRLQLRVPADHIDQVFVGQTGKLTINSLPARNAPDLNVSIRSIAEDPVKDQHDVTQHYLAEATISADDLAAAQIALDDRFNLVLGMPVSVALAGDNTTFWEFLTSPLISIWSGAFEE